MPTDRCMMLLDVLLRAGYKRDVSSRRGNIECTVNCLKSSCCPGKTNVQHLKIACIAKSINIQAPSSNAKFCRHHSKFIAVELIHAGVQQRDERIMYFSVSKLQFIESNWDVNSSTPFQSHQKVNCIAKDICLARADSSPPRCSRNNLLEGFGR